MDIDQFHGLKSESPEQELDNKFRIKALHLGIGKLKPAEKAVILLYLEDKSYDEIADITGLTSKNVSVKLVRIKKKLQKILASVIQS